MSLTDWSTGALVIAFVIAGGVIGVAGTRLAGLADRIADRTGLGEALTGGLFLGICTSLSGITASVTAAVDGYPALAVSNALGGIAVQTAFLAIADLAYPKVNLEHAAASVPNLVQACLLVILLTLVLLFLTGPDVTVGHVHPGTGVILVAYLFGLRLAFRSRSRPMWSPVRTRETVEDQPAPGAEKERLVFLGVGFAVAAACVVAGGMTIAHVSGILVSRTGVSQSLMGGVFMAVATSLPELVTTVAAVRRGALTLAVSDIVGGNAFDVLFVCAADLAYVKGSIYHAVDRTATFMAGLAILLNVVLLMGLISREKRGMANIGFESILILVLYASGLAVIQLMG